MDAECRSVGSSHESNWSDAEDETYEFKAFHDDEIFETLNELLEHERRAHDFDLQKLRSDLKLDLYGTIKVVNCVRLQKTSEKDIRNNIDKIQADESLLHPTLENDAVLFHLVDDEEVETSSTDPKNEWKAKFEALEAQHALLQQALRSNLQERADKIDQESVAPDNDTYYFDSYGYNDIHETMLKDTVRTDAYRDAVYDNKDIFKDKVVLDVGCGTGILSMFCAKAGAKHVYAIDNSNIIDKARSNAYENDLDDKITFIKGKVEQISLPVECVDIIISEWMGYALLYESMLDSVLTARDRFLKKDGLMLPSITTMVVAGLSDKDYYDDRVNFWSDIYGFKMGAMKDGIFDDVLIDSLSASSLGTKPTIFKSLDLHATSIEDLVFTAPFTLEPLPGHDSIIAFHIWFDTFFTRSRLDSSVAQIPIEGSVRTKSGNSFSTGPHGKATHWKQAVLLIDGHVAVPAGSHLVGEIEYRKGASNPRYLEIVITWQVTAKSGGQVNGTNRSQSQVWHLT